MILFIFIEIFLISVVLLCMQMHARTIDKRIKLLTKIWDIQANVNNVLLNNHTIEHKIMIEIKEKLCQKNLEQ
jgi:hypothetical protein